MAATTLSDPRYDVYESFPVNRETSASWELLQPPLESLDNKGDIRFKVDASNQDWMDLYHAVITFEVRIVKKDGTTLVETASGSGGSAVAKDSCMLINNAAHAVFKDLRVRINESMIAGGDGNYAHIAFVANQYQYSHAAKSTFKADEGYFSPEFSSTSKEFSTDWDHPTNEALTKAYDGSKWVFLTLPLNGIPIFNQDKAIPPAHKFELELVRNDPKFCIWAKESGREYDFEFRNMQLNIPMLRPSEEVQRPILQKMNTSKIIYPYTDLQMYRRTVVSNQTETVFYNVFHNKDVKLAFFVLLPSDVYYNHQKRKYIFKRCHLDTIDLRAEGRSIAGKPVEAKNISKAYHQMNRSLKLNERNEDIGITRDDFNRYANVYSFDCTPGRQFEQRQEARARQYDLHLKFDTTLTKNYDVFCFFSEDKQFNFQPGNLVVPSDYAQSS